jgi:hypothetical protein
MFAVKDVIPLKAQYYRSFEVPLLISHSRFTGVIVALTNLYKDEKMEIIIISSVALSLLKSFIFHGLIYITNVYYICAISH